MNKKIVLLFVLFFVLPAGLLFVIFNEYTNVGLIISGNYEKYNNYHIYTPRGIGNNKTLIYIITASGSETDATNYIKYWKVVAQKNNYVLASPINWNEDVLILSIREILKKDSFSKVVVTGLSNGGYNSCHLGLKYPELFDGVIPMGAYCEVFDVKVKNNPIPILAVNGENDLWARGNDLKNVDIASEELKKLGVMQSQIVVPGLGHAFPVSTLNEIVKWINNL